MIQTLLRVEEQDIQRKGHAVAFVEALTEWEILPWVKYLREHGTIVSVDRYQHIDTKYQYQDTYKIIWELPPEHQTYFYLAYDNQCS